MKFYSELGSEGVDIGWRRVRLQKFLNACGMFWVVPVRG